MQRKLPCIEKDGKKLENTQYIRGGELIGDALTYTNNLIGVVGGLGLATASRRADPRNSTGDIVWGDVVDGASFVKIPRKTKVLNLEKNGWGMYKRKFKKNKVIGLLDLINDGQGFANDLSNAAQVYEEEQHNLKEADRIAHELEQKRRREIIRKSIENAKYKKFIGR